MEKRIVLVFFATIFFSVGVFLLDQSYLAYHQKWQDCDALINGSDTNNGSPKGFARQLYYECTIQPRDMGDCYARYHQAVTDCLNFRKETMTEKQIRQHIVSEKVEINCQDPYKACLGYKEMFPSSDYVGLVEAMTEVCIWKTRKNCADIK